MNLILQGTKIFKVVTACTTQLQGMNHLYPLERSLLIKNSLFLFLKCHFQKMVLGNKDRYSKDIN